MILRYRDHYTNYYINLSQVTQAYTAWDGINICVTDGNLIHIELKDSYRELKDIILDRLSELDWNAVGVITLSELISKD